jgi:hypothetical protein
MTAQPVITELEELYDVPALADGEGILKQGGVLTAAALVTDGDLGAALAAKTFASLDDVPTGDGVWVRESGALVWKPESDFVASSDARLTDTRTPTDGTVTTAKIVDGAVTSAKFAAGAVATALGGAQTPLASMQAGIAPAQGATSDWLARIVKRAASIEAANKFTYQRVIKVDNTAGPAKSSAWPVKVALTSSNMTFANARNDGRDLQFRLPDGTIAPHWVASYDPVAQTAEIWVKMPPLALGASTVTLLYGNPDWLSPFLIGDVFPSGVDFKSVREAFTHPTLSAQTIIFTKDEAWESTSGAHTLDIIDFGTAGKLAPNGQTYRFWGWYGHYGADGIGLAWANDPAGPWTKYASNPILDSTAHARWATVKQADDGTFHMIIQNTSSNDLRRYTLSADGVTATFVEIVAADSGFTMGNGFIFRDPATSDYICWFFRQRNSDSLQEVCYRRSATIPGITQAQTIVVQTSPLVYAAPAMVYFDGLYWLYCEDYDNSGQLWRTFVQTAPTPTGPFTPCSNSILLAADQPCARAYVIDGVLYLYNAQRNGQSNSDWSFGVHTATPSKSQPTLPATQSSPGAGFLQSYSLYGQPASQYDATVGAGAPAPLIGRLSGVGATLSVDKSILAGATLPADHIFAVRVAKKAALNVYFGVRAAVNGARYRIDLGTATGHIDTSTGWHAGGVAILTQGSLSSWTLGDYHLVECVCQGTTISAKVDGSQVMTVVDATYSAGGFCSVETPNGTDMAIDYAYGRPYDGTDPVVTVGSELSAAPVTPKTRAQILSSAGGVITETENPSSLAIFTAASGGAVYGRLLGLRAGDVITGLVVRVSVAAAGTAPTTVRVGLADATGKILVLSGNLNAASNFPAGAAILAFTAPYTVLADGGYYPVLFVSGVWGSTSPTLLNTGVQTATNGALGAFAPPGITWTGQTDLPAIGSSVTLSTASVRSFYMGLY